MSEQQYPKQSEQPTLEDMVQQFQQALLPVVQVYQQAGQAMEKVIRDSLLSRWQESKDES